MQQNLNSIDLSLLVKEFNKKECLKHTFHLKGLNIYYYIPIFQQSSIIKFRNQYYIILELKRRTETYLQYKVKDRWNYKQEILIQYQYFFDKDLMDDKYEYFEDQTQALSRDDQIFRQYSRIAIKKQDIHNNSSLKLPRFIHLNNYNQYGKIQILYHLSNYKTKDLLDYNQIQINDLWQVEIIQRNQNKNQLFIQAPITMDQKVEYQQILLIGIYYVIIHNLVIFNRYLNEEYHLEQSLRSFNSSHQHLQQLIIESIKCKHELQTPKNVLAEIKNQISYYRKIIICFLIIKKKSLIKNVLQKFHANFKIKAQKKLDNFLKIGQNFIQITQLINKNSRIHTFQLPKQNDYWEIPIFQKNEKIKFQNQFYQILKLQRRTETYLQYKIQNLDTLQVFSIEYQFIFDSNQKDYGYQYFSDETCTFNDHQSYKQSCRIALKKSNEYPKLQKLTRFVHLNNLNQRDKIALLHDFANDDQLEQLDYNQIYINHQQQIIKEKKNQFYLSCFIQAPTSISDRVSFKQTFLIGFYYCIINNIVMFNSYFNKQKMIEQSLKVRLNYYNFRLENQIIGSINYQYKYQIPKNVLKKAINKFFMQQQLAYYCLIIFLIDIFQVIMNTKYYNNIQIAQSNEQEEHNTFMNNVYQLGVLRQSQDLQLIYCNQITYFDQIQNTIKKTVQTRIQNNSQQNFDDIILQKNRIESQINHIEKGIKQLKQLTKHLKDVDQKSTYLLNSYNSQHSEDFIDLPQKTNFLENIINRSQKQEKFMKNKLQKFMEFDPGILYYESKKQYQSIFDGCRFAAYINEDPHIQILIELKQLFQMVEDLLDIKLETNTFIDISSLRHLKEEIVDKQ